MGRGNRVPSARPMGYEPPARARQYDPEAARPLHEIHQRVDTPAGGFECVAAANLLVRVTGVRPPQRTHLLSAKYCSCREEHCQGRQALAVAVVRGFAAFAPLNPTERPWEQRVYQAIPDAGAEGRAIVRADAWGEIVEILIERGNTVTRHLRTAGSCSCADQNCEAVGWLRLAMNAGLDPFVPQAAAYVLTSDEPWTWTSPYGLAPRLGPAVVHATRVNASEVVITESGGLRPARYRVRRDACECVRGTDCLHRQLAARVMAARL